MANAVWGPVVIFDQVMYQRPFGVVRKWMDGVTVKFVLNAKRYAPEQTGTLRSMITGDVDRVGPRQIEGVIASNAPYSLYVLRGTEGPIMANRAWNLTHGDHEMFHMLYEKRKKGQKGLTAPRRGMMLRFTSTELGKQVITPWVRGQDANNFLLEAWAATARTHSSLRGVTVPAAIASP